MNRLAVGIDIGGTNTVFGLTNRKGEILFEESIRTKDFANAEELIQTIYDLIPSNHKTSIVGVGIGAPNGNYFTGTIDFAPNLPWSGVIPLKHISEKIFNISTTITNDANAAAIGEMVYGNAKDLKEFITITLGTGLGSGIIVDGKIVYGHDGFAGELGHFRVTPNGRTCNCGRKGCLETYASSTGVVRSIHELNSSNKAYSKIHKVTSPQAKDVFHLAENGDLFCLEIIDYTAEILGNALAEFTTFSSPKAFILFGGIAQSGEFFRKKVNAVMEKGMLSIYQNTVEVRISTLHDKNAAVLGASSLVW